MTFFTVWLVLWEQLTVQFFLSICCCCTLDKQCWWTGRRSWCTKQSWQSAVFDGFMKFYESEKRSAAVAAQPTMTSAVAVKVFLRCLNISLGKVGLNESVSFGWMMNLKGWESVWALDFINALEATLLPKIVKLSVVSQMLRWCDFERLKFWSLGVEWNKI